MKTQVDIVIVGGGLVGAALAALLARNTQLSIALVDQQSLPQYIPNDYRVSAMGPAAIQLFESVGAFSLMKATNVSPYVEMKVWDGSSRGCVHFDTSFSNEKQLGYIIENSLMQFALHEVLSMKTNVTRYMSATPTAFLSTESAAVLTLASGEVINASLAIAADGAHSWLRNAANIAVLSQDHHESALVAYVETEKPHEAVARQLFLPTGPLAFLPLSKPHWHSIVWSLPQATANTYAAMDNLAFASQLTRAFEMRLGAVKTVQDKHVFSLRSQQATTYVKPRLALVGDAAHTVHPLAGLGVNLGLMDAASLTDVILKAQAAQEDIGEFRVLRRYARWRAAENQPLLKGVDIIKRCFAVQQPSFSVLRGVGMEFTNRFQGLKKRLIQAASLNFPR